MRLDTSTLEDLEIDQATRDETALLAFLNRARLPETRHRLRDLALKPLSSVSAIYARQRDLKLLAALPATIWPESLRRIVDRVELYLASRRSRYPRSAVGALTAQWRNTKVHAATLDGLRATRELLAFLERFEKAVVEAAPGEGELSDLLTDIRGRAAHAALKSLTAERTEWRLVRHDGVVRVEHGQQLYAIVQCVYAIDALWSLATLASMPGFTYPEFVADGAPFVTCEGLFHPLLHDPQANDVAVGKRTSTTRSLIFLTGPNMAGKSTYLRACALLVVLAHVGCAVPAHRARLTIFDRVFASLAVRDSLQRGESFYLAEVRRVGELARYLSTGETVFAVLDEIFKGTNVHDALDATELVVSSLVRCPTANTIVASHLSELAEQRLSKLDVGLFHFDATESHGRLHFDYRCSTGVSHRRMGMRILETEGVAAMLRGLETPEQLADMSRSAGLDI